MDINNDNKERINLCLSDNDKIIGCITLDRRQ